MSSVRNGSERIREKERKSGGVRKANNYYTDGGTDERRRMKERFGRKYSEQQAREGGRREEAGRERVSERGRSLTDLLTVVVETQRPDCLCLPACPGLSG